MLYEQEVRIPSEKWKGFLDETSQFARGFVQHIGDERAPETAAAK
jgi:hypothetical protein